MSAAVRVRDDLDASMLQRAWGSFAGVYTKNWSGDPADTKEAVDKFKEIIPVLARTAKEKSRTFVIVGHSWGSVLGYIWSGIR